MVGSLATGVAAGILPPVLLLLVAGVSAALALLRPGLPASLHRWTGCIGLAGSMAAALVTLHGLRLAPGGVGLVAYGGSLVVDRFSILVTMVAAILGLLLVLGVGHTAERLGRRGAALHPLLLASVAATSLAASTREMASLFLDLQLLAASTAALLALAKTNRRSGEAALKQALTAATGSAVLLQGFAILYGLTGSTDLARVAGAAARFPAPAAAGLALTLAGLAVTLGAVPLQRWGPQVSAGVPAPIGGAVLALDLLAGLAAALRVTVGGAGSTRISLDLVAALAAATMLWAAAMLVRPRPLRQVAGYLVMAQTGVLLAGIVSVAQGTDRRAGIVALLVGAMGTVAAVPALLGAIGLLEAAGMGHGIDAHHGAGHRARGVGALLALSLLALGGLPPASLFVARVLLIEDTIVTGYAWLGIVAVLTAAVTAAASIRLLASLYAVPEEEGRLRTSASPRLVHAAVGLCAAAGVVFTAVVQPLLAVSSGGAGTLPPR